MCYIVILESLTAKITMWQFNAWISSIIRPKQTKCLLWYCTHQDAPAEEEEEEEEEEEMVVRLFFV